MASGRYGGRCSAGIEKEKLSLTPGFIVSFHQLHFWALRLSRPRSPSLLFPPSRPRKGNVEKIENAFAFFYLGPVVILIVVYWACQMRTSVPWPKHTERQQKNTLPEGKQQRGGLGCRVRSRGRTGLREQLVESCVAIRHGEPAVCDEAVIAIRSDLLDNAHR